MSPARSKLPATAAPRGVADAPAIEMSTVSKGFPTWFSTDHTPRAVLRRRLPGLGGKDLRWALRDVSLTVAAGGCTAVIGDNGAGKSTLLKLCAGLSLPTRGTVRAPSSLAAVLALGEAFDLSLSGRENAYTTALLAGYGRAEAKAILSDVIEFAHLEEVADEPVRTYSEGMKLRLAFGVIAQLRPEALLFDEVIAVGDGAFQAKCLAHVRQLREEHGTAVLMATHDLTLVDEHCDHAIWLEAGRVRLEGAPAEVTAAYRNAMHTETVDRTPEPDGPSALELRRNRFGSQEIRIERVELESRAGSPAVGVPGDADLRIRLHLTATSPAEAPPAVVISLRRAGDGTICLELNSQAGGVAVPVVDRDVVVEAEVESLDLVPGEYDLEIGVYRSDWRYAYDLHSGVHTLRIAGEPVAGIVKPRGRWTFGA